MSQPSTRQPGELAFSLAVLIFSLFAGWQAWRIAGFSSLSSAGVFPMIATFTMIVSGIVVVAEAARARPAACGNAAARFFAEVTPLRLVIFALMIVGYMLALEPAGFLVSSFAFLFAGMAYLYRRSILLSLAVSAVSLAVIYVVFRHVFSVVLPAGRLF